MPQTTRRTNHSVLDDYSAKRIIMKLKLKYFELLILRHGSLEKIECLGKIEGIVKEDNRRQAGRSMIG